MAAAMKMENISDEEWLVVRARSCMKSDPYAAKAWMITARTLFPYNFTIQFEAYTLEKTGRNVKESAKLLEEMFQSFPQESRLWTEVHSILEALQAESTESRSQFLTEIFAAVPTNIQCQMLLNVAEKIGDILEQCRLLLLAMKKFPSLVTEHGLKLIETLITAEHRSQFSSPVNCYRKLFVCDVLPLVLQKFTNLDSSSMLLYKWLQRAIEFYISYVTQPPSQELMTPKSPELLSPTKKSVKKMVTIHGLLDKESQVWDPWGSLFKLLALIGNHMKWDMEANMFTKTKDYQWQHILNLFNRSKQPGADKHTRQILYTTTVLFLECLYSYVSSVDPDIFAGSGISSQTTPMVLIEGFKISPSSGSSEPKAKRSRGESMIPQIQATASVSDSQSIIQNFLTALKCYELLHSSAELQREFRQLCQNMRMETWTWMGHFQTDMFIYQGNFQDAVATLQNFPLHGTKGKSQLRSSLQLACCFYCLGNYAKACELVLDVVSTLAESVTSDGLSSSKQAPVKSGSGRRLLLALCTEAEIMPYCIQLLLTCCKDRAFSSQQDDMSLGHMIILLQYNWPKHEQLLGQVVQQIQAQGSFTYNIFFNYVINIDILEEFAHLRSPDGGKVNLDILPTSTKIIAQQRTVTRGVNKGVKEDFRATMEKQVRRCDESVDQVLRQFLMEERQLILQNLL